MVSQPLLGNNKEAGKKLLQTQGLVCKNQQC